MATATAVTPSVHLAILLLSASTAHGGSGRVLANLKEKLSHLHFFLHEVLSGRNPTGVQIADPVAAGTSKSFFGMVSVMDHLLTEGEDPASKPVGRAQGVHVGTDLRELAILQAMNLVIAEGEYNGSVITVLGWNAPYHEVREMPVVGGSGLFQFARSYAQVRTRSFSGKSVAVLEYDVYVLHS